MTAPLAAIAIPARDEAALIGRCLDALAAQQGVARAALDIVVLANDCTDDTAALARAHPLAPRVVEQRFAPGAGGAGPARRAAVAATDPDAPIVLTTDADGVAAPDWVARHLDAFAAGADAVAGRVLGDWAELSRRPAAELRVGALEWDYLALAARLADRLDPVPHDPWPRHLQACGANIGVRRAVLDAVGGVPALTSGEDRALLAAITSRDGRVRHDPAPVVTVSARLEGRAAGGMADALAARSGPAYLSDEQFEALPARIARLRLRAGLRAAHGAGPAAWSEALRRTGLPQHDCPEHFGAGWAALEASVPALGHTPLGPAALAEATAGLAAWLDEPMPSSVIDWRAAA